MHDIRLIRENPDAFDASLARRGLSPVAHAILDLDTQRRAAQTSMQELQAKRNEASRQVGEIKRQGGATDALMQEVAAMKAELARLEEEDRALGIKLTEWLAALPNLLAADVPLGKDENDNKELRRFGTPRLIEAPRQHFELGETLNLMDFETAAKLSGARFTILRGGLARLERALGDFMLDTLTEEFGYTEISPPLLVKNDAMFGTAQLPKFAEDQFAVYAGFGKETATDKTAPSFWLIPTAEVPLTNMVREQITERGLLPLRVTAKTPCFRSEAGAAGRDTRGMIRQHQFYKVEMVSVTAPDESDAEHERMVACAETILNRLELPFRTIVLCSGDTGFAARKTYDIEVWLPGQKAYREISSCSNCGDFQARRMNARCRTEGEKQTEFVHTLNGSGVAIGRCLIAVMENYQQPDGSIAVPLALRKYMNAERIG